MKDIKVLGTGCANCRSTVDLIETVAKARGVPITLEKIEDLPAIVACLLAWLIGHNARRTAKGRTG